MLSRKALRITAGVLVAAMIIAAVFSMPVFAAEITEDISGNTVSENIQSDEDRMTKIFGPNVHTGENGKPVYTDENGEEHEMELSGDFENYIDDDERFETESERRLRIDQMAQEDGNKVPAQDYGEGDAPDDVKIGGVAPDDRTGYLTIHADVPVNVHEEVYVYFMHMGTMKEYGIYLYEINNYSGSLCLPAGNYMVEEGGLSLDSSNKYFAVTRQFRIEPCETAELEVVIHNVDDNADGTEVRRSMIEEEKEETSEVSGNTANIPPDGIEEVTTPGLGGGEEEKTDKSNILSSVLSIGFTLGLFAVAFILAKKYLGFDVTDQHRGFDE